MIKPGRQINTLATWDILKKLYKIEIYNETTTPLLKNMRTLVWIIINLYYQKYLEADFIFRRKNRTLYRK
jgi:hypothetical protein